MKLSVIIPTYNRSNSLDRTLETLVSQTIGTDNYEILVVDNNSTDNTAEVIKTWEKNTNGLVHYLQETRPGAHYARNGAVKYAKGDILYFTDDDILANEDMLENIIKPFAIKDKNIATVTGQVLPYWEVEPPRWVLRYMNNAYLSLNTLPDDLIVDSKDVGIFSNHQAVLKKVFLEVGGYNPDIVNGEWLGDNETGMNIKIEQKGYQFAYIKSAIIYHMIPARRMTQSYINGRLANQGNSDAYTNYRATTLSNNELRKINLSLYKKMWCTRFTAIVNILRKKDNWHIKWAKAFYYRNYIKYNRRLIKDASFRQMVLKNNWIEE